MIHYKKDTENIVTLTLDMDQRPVNIINHELEKAFLPVLRHLKAEKEKGLLRGVIMTSAKKTFLAGGDLDFLYHSKDSKEIFETTEQLSRFFREIEVPGVPVVAAMNGSALGPGFGLALACHYRVLINKSEHKVGFPELSLGLMPGGGAVIRLLWMLGFEKAWEVLTSGKRYSPQEAFNVGIVDQLADDEADMLNKAKDWLMEHQEGRRLWDKEGAVIPEGSVNEPKIGAILQRLAATLFQEKQNNYPAYHAILNTLSEGSKVDFDTACRIQSRYFANLVKGKEAKNMMKAIWYDYNNVRNGSNRPKGFGKFRPRKIGIIGAGTMGSAIAYICILSGLEVILKDVSEAVASIGKEYSANQLKLKVKNQELTQTESEALLANIKITDNAKDFVNCDVLVESVFENSKVKSKALKEAEEYLDEYAIVASNTSSIPITQLAETTLKPHTFVGMRFFKPADTEPLIEIVRAKQTDDETIAKAFDFVRAIHKIPIIVKDSWGYFAARVQNTYILEGIALLNEGYAASLIENISLNIGMHKSPLAMADDISLELVREYENQASFHYGKQYITHPALVSLDLMINQLKRTGAQKKNGFYQYNSTTNPIIWENLHTYFPISQTQFNRQEIEERLFFSQVLEAAWCLQEGIIATIEEADLGSIFGWGFPASKGGVIQYIMDYGVEKFINRCHDFEKRFGQRFKVPKIVKKMMV